MARQHIPDLWLELYLLDELDEPMRSEVTQLLQSDNEILQRYQKLQQSNEEILSLYPAQSFAHKLKEKARTRGNIHLHIELDETEKDQLRQVRNTLNRWSRWGYGLAAVLVVMIAVSINEPTQMSDQPQAILGDDIRTKGLKPSLSIYLNRENKIRELHNQDQVAAGDVIQLAYTAVDYRYGLIISVDGLGNISRHFPEQGDQAAPLLNKPQSSLNYSFELDDAPGFEQFIFIASKQEFAIAELMHKARQQLQAGTPLQLQAGKDFIVQSTTLRK